MLHDANYIVGAGADTRVLWGCFLDLVNAIACVGTAVTLFPVVKRQHEAVALGFVTARVFEAAVIVIGVVCLLAVVTCGRTWPEGRARTTVRWSPSGSPSSPSAIGRSPSAPASFRASTRCSWATCCTGPGWCHVPSPCWGSSALPCSSRPRPRPCSATATLFRGNDPVTVLAAVATVPIFLWELSLGVWLVIKGFKPSPITSGMAGPTVAS